MAQLHFHSIQGKSLDIIDAIVKTEEVASVVKNWAMLSVVVEELVVNIVDYAHSDYLDVEIVRDKKCIILRFHDGGVPFNPLDKTPPDVSLPMELRAIGGMGFYIVTKKMDSVEYEYTAGENVLTVMKKL